MRTVAIMQPTFLPWLGYFAMIDAVDAFVFLDSVQFARRSWQQRNRIKTPSGVQWITVPVASKGRRDQLISEVQVDDSQKFRAKLTGTLQSNYAKAAYFKTYSDDYLAIIRDRDPSLANLNIRLIELVVRQLGINGKVFARSSELLATGSKADLLAEICREMGYRSYLSAPGSQEYIEASTAFEEAGIDVIYHQYQHPRYTQLFGSFESKLSIVDLIFNEGPKSLGILRSGAGTSSTGDIR